MHLKSLTLKGFKSFASATTLQFEPGITCVVGPNGSGKSNVVDALAWVMGEQGAKVLRGGSMQDVIFAGTAGRPPLGRAEVSVTIDNADGALPIDYAEVQITRTMFRGGGSDYAINGQGCRLLDVQELLSDSGIGREMHVIVGQGRLDAVLAATAEERRGFIEEAAGVLKHRKRKEKALRKLDAMQANLARVQDLTVELRRQLGPLGRQAGLARRAATIAADVRDARSRLLADDLVQLRVPVIAGGEGDPVERREQAEAALARILEQQREMEEAGGEREPRHARLQQCWYELSAVGERVRATQALAQERLRAASLAAGPDEASARDPEQLERAARQAREEEAALLSRLADDRRRLAQAQRDREDAEHAHLSEDARVGAALRAAADRREGLARLTGTVDARRSRVEAGESEVGRLAAAIEEAAARRRRAERDYAALETQVAGLDEGEVGLDEEHERAADALGATRRHLESLRADEQRAQRGRAAALARRDALRAGLVRDGAGALTGAEGVIGTVAELLDVEPGCEAAVAAALGAAADGVAVAGPGAALAAARLLRDADAGRAALLVGGAPDPGPSLPAGPLPDGARAVLELVRAPECLRGAVHALLGGSVLVEDLDQAGALLEAAPDLVAVTAAGDVLSRVLSVAGAGGGVSGLEARAAAEAAERALAETVAGCERVRFELLAVQERERAEAARLDATLERLHESDARMAAVAESLAQLGGAVRAAAGESERLQRARAAAQRQLDADRAALRELAARLAAATEGDCSGDSSEADEPDPAEGERLAARAQAARRVETELRLEVRTAEERVRALAGRAAGLERAAADGRAASERAALRRARSAREAQVAAAVATGTGHLLAAVETSLARVGAALRDAETARAERAEAVRQLRERERLLAGELEALVDAAHRAELARTEQRLRLEAVEQRVRDELGADPVLLVEEYGPHLPVPSAPTDAEQAPAARTYDRREQERRLRTAERALAQLGRVNPLALEEHAALEERHRFLVEQVEDLKGTRRDLLDIVSEVDGRVQQVFMAAFRDTAREFEHVFARLFPGGQGRLVLTDPENPLTTGVEVEARPPGKKVKRLSLLSGGERSLTAVALLVAIFKARPSPFYVLDEVEAALDDTNLGRLLVILEELRAASQLIVVTHQKRTMEVADALYGASMRGDGVTTVISQRLRRTLPESA